MDSGVEEEMSSSPLWLLESTVEDTSGSPVASSAVWRMTEQETGEPRPAKWSESRGTRSLDTLPALFSRKAVTSDRHLLKPCWKRHLESEGG